MAVRSDCDHLYTLSESVRTATRTIGSLLRQQHKRDDNPPHVIRAGVPVVEEFERFGVEREIVGALVEEK